MELRASVSTWIITMKTEEPIKNLAHEKDKDFFVSHAETHDPGTANDWAWSQCRTKSSPLHIFKGAWALKSLSDTHSPSCFKMDGIQCCAELWSIKYTILENARWGRLACGEIEVCTPCLWRCITPTILTICHIQTKTDGEKKWSPTNPLSSRILGHSKSKQVHYCITHTGLTRPAQGLSIAAEAIPAHGDWDVQYIWRWWGP